MLFLWLYLRSQANANEYNKACSKLKNDYSSPDLKHQLLPPYNYQEQANYERDFRLYELSKLTDQPITSFEGYLAAMNSYHYSINNGFDTSLGSSKFCGRPFIFPSLKLFLSGAHAASDINRALADNKINSFNNKYIPGFLKLGKLHINPEKIQAHTNNNTEKNLSDKSRELIFKNPGQNTSQNTPAREDLDAFKTQNLFGFMPGEESSEISEILGSLENNDDE